MHSMNKFGLCQPLALELNRLVSSTSLLGSDMGIWF